VTHYPRKRYGQHFLHDRGVIAKVIAAIDPQPDDALVEIGPGQGALTAPLLERLAKLHAIEIDRDLAAQLAAKHDPTRLILHQADVLRFDFAQLPGQLRIVGNLPYNISTPLLFHLIAYGTRVRDMHFMLQREVVARMVAAPSTADYGRLSVMLQYRFAMTKLFEVSAGAFRPPPKVASAIVRMVPIAPPEVVDESLFARVVTAAFTKRRKTLRNALEGLLEEEDLHVLGIEPRLRPENLSLNEYVAITKAIAQGQHRKAS
jgi:16S rRNA (adenine1518-N6/adenine1519-N6)-dimethyltransferase